MFSPPPPNADPGDLFRAIVRGEAPLSYRVSAAPGLPLRVRAPSSLLTAEAYALARAGAWPDAQALVLPAVLLTPKGPAFASPEEAGLLPEHDGVKLWADVWNTLIRIAPMVDLHWSEWYAVLKKGAESPGNRHLAIAMGRCLDVGWRCVTPRPDLFYGRAVSELSDAQYLAWRVCADEWLKQL